MPWRHTRHCRRFRAVTAGFGCSEPARSAGATSVRELRNIVACDQRARRARKTAAITGTAPPDRMRHPARILGAAEFVWKCPRGASVRLGFPSLPIAFPAAHVFAIRRGPSLPQRRQLHGRTGRGKHCVVRRDGSSQMGSSTGRHRLAARVREYRCLLQEFPLGRPNWPGGQCDPIHYHPAGAPRERL